MRTEKEIKQQLVFMQKGLTRTRTEMKQNPKDDLLEYIEAIQILRIRLIKWVLK